MRILAIADVESPYYWDYFKREYLDGIDLILSCGDLNPNYLSFLATFTTSPVLYVRGNHDDKYEKHPPEGCFCIEDQIYVHNGIRILGLGGSMRYKPGINQYTDRNMNARIRKKWLSLQWHHGVDILLTHAPAYGIQDGKDLPHRGFKGFVNFIDHYKPQYFIHGHNHMCYDSSIKRVIQHGDTTIINAYNYHIFECEPRLNYKSFGPKLRGKSSSNE